MRLPVTVSSRLNARQSWSKLFPELPPKASSKRIESIQCDSKSSFRFVVDKFSELRHVLATLAWSHFKMSSSQRAGRQIVLRSLCTGEMIGKLCPNQCFLGSRFCRQSAAIHFLWASTGFFCFLPARILYASLFGCLSSLYSRIKIFVFAVNSKRHFSILVWFT